MKTFGVYLKTKTHDNTFKVFLGFARNWALHAAILHLRNHVGPHDYRAFVWFACVSLVTYIKTRRKSRNMNVIYENRWVSLVGHDDNSKWG
ncbi:hypothetical protein HanIR_Chr13g0619601 [Helianthus annuus]|nr:hypothetical protein HanIR_Chr13g0619601 [Helianthus annuus]